MDQVGPLATEATAHLTEGLTWTEQPLNARTLI